MPIQLPFLHLQYILSFLTVDSPKGDKLRRKILKCESKVKARMSPFLPFNHCFQQNFYFDQKQHGTGEPDLGLGDIWHNIIS